MVTLLLHGDAEADQLDEHSMVMNTAGIPTATNTPLLASAAHAPDARKLTGRMCQAEVCCWGMAEATLVVHPCRQVCQQALSSSQIACPVNNISTCMLAR
jgi:hypothetical protein